MASPAFASDQVFYVYYSGTDLRMHVDRFTLGSPATTGASRVPVWVGTVVGAATTPSGARWLGLADGRVVATGGAPHHGDMGGQRLNAPVVDMAATPLGGGYCCSAPTVGSSASATPRSAVRPAACG